MKIKSKAQMMWEVSKEAEENFMKEYPFVPSKYDMEDLFKMIRGAEYRRGKEDGRTEIDATDIDIAVSGNATDG